ncbi:hypothetical protein B0H17DRAFT_1127575 [Mycena rosella]|uniref:Uncharacterized protein n=1 Tax=Mycena rosella TaxID=1033263 RepID=A0AAD7GNV4_MYCRO|nr:hypothetical protein B0H17DRAFT_1127575 [Mycena rosella]
MGGFRTSGFDAITTELSALLNQLGEIHQIRSGRIRTVAVKADGAQELARRKLNGPAPVEIGEIIPTLLDSTVTGPKSRTFFRVKNRFSDGGIQRDPPFRQPAGGHNWVVERPHRRDPQHIVEETNFALAGSVGGEKVPHSDSMFAGRHTHV